MITLKSIFYYPVKALRGIETSQALIARSGIQYDRRWMIVNHEGRFITQRQHNRLALVNVQQTQDEFRLFVPDHGEASIPVELKNAERARVSVWRDECEALWLDSAANQWISDFLGESASFVYMPDSTQRLVDPEYATRDDDSVSFADGFPLLVIGQSSLDELNQHTDEPILMQRFRPNLVVENAPAYAEDQWQVIEINGVRISLVKPCSRCVVPSIDIATGQRGKQPTQYLLKHRRQGDKTYFGQNGIPQGCGEVLTGAPVGVTDSVS